MTQSVYGGSPLDAAARARFIELREAIQILAGLDAQSELLRLANAAEAAAAHAVTEAVMTETHHAAVLRRISELGEAKEGER